MHLMVTKLALIFFCFAGDRCAGLLLVVVVVVVVVVVTLGSPVRFTFVVSTFEPLKP